MERVGIDRERLFAKAVEESSIPFAVAHPDGRILFVNGAFARLTGFSEDELLSQTKWSTDLTPPEWRDATARALEALNRTGEPQRYEKEYVRKDGSRIPIELFVHLARRADGTIAYYYSFITDLSEKRKAISASADSERRFRTLANTIPQLTWTTDPTGKCDYVNDRWLHFTRRKLEEVREYGWLDLVHDDDRPQVMKRWERSVTTGEDFEVEFRILNANTGQYEWFLTRGSPVRGARGEVSRWIGTNTNISELRQAQEELKEAVRARDTFLSIASHELKTPLTSLKLQTQTLRRTVKKAGIASLTPEAFLRNLEATEKQVNRLIRLVDDMLDIARLQTGRLTIERSPFDLCELAGEIVERLAGNFQEIGSTLELRTCKSAVGKWDRTRIEQVITNLLTNALRYGKGRPVTVGVDQLSGHVHIWVRDQGIGIAKEHQERIFERFERAISATEISGLGLGLYIARQIVESHGGRIHVESEPGRGATFHVELPIYPAQRL